MGSVIPQQVLNADVFYAERDARGGLEHALSALPPRRIAIAVPPDVTSVSIGLETALFWTASIIRRMGRAFAEVILVSTNEFRQCQSLLSRNIGVTVEQLLSNELRSADPFGRVEWRSWGDDTDLADAAATIWLGTLPLGARPAQTIAVSAHGWVAAVHESPAADLSLSPTDFDAAPAAIAMAACMVSARLFSDAFGRQERPPRIAFALDNGTVTTDEVVSSQLLANGTGCVDGAPWKDSRERKPSLEKILIVSAGGIGGNFCRILGSSFFQAASAYVLDPDNFDLSNLNRAVGVGLQAVGTSKAAIAADALSPCTITPLGVQSAYESWVTTDIAEQFRQEGAAVVVGVDQVRTRLIVGSDWPSTLLNGATSGSTFSTGIYMRTTGGCIGCWYGQDEAAYLATRTPMACAAGVAPGIMAFRQVASYAFVSVAAAAYLVAMLIRIASRGDDPKSYAGTVLSMSLRSPECAQIRRIAISQRCLLLCGADYVQGSLQRVTEEH